MQSHEINRLIRERPDLSNDQIARMVGSNRKAIGMRRVRMRKRGIDVPPSTIPSENTLEQEEKRDINEVVEEKGELYKQSKKRKFVEKENRALYEQLEKTRRELNAILKLQSESHTHKIQPRKSSGSSEAVAIALLSDTHYEEEVKPDTVGGRNRYNLDIAKVRNDEFFERVVRMIRKERQDIRIDKLVLGILGDLITGNIHDSVSMDSCLLAPIDACIFAQEMIESGIRFILENEPKLEVVVVCKFGNHSRTTKFVHINNEGGYATEKLIYANLASRFKEEKRVTFIVEDSYLTHIDIMGRMVRFHHGHFVRYAGGVGGLTIPLNKAIDGWNDDHLHTAFDCLGHFHNYHPMGRFVVNGSMIGYNSFAVSLKVKFQPALQAFFLVDRKRGKTVHIPILFSV